MELFEKNASVGGKLSVLERDGFSFDLGPSILILPQLFERVFARAGRRMADYLRLEEVHPQWRSFFADGTTLDLHADIRLMERELAKLGGGAAGYWDFVAYSRRLWQRAEAAYLQPGADTAWEIARGHGLRDPRWVTELAWSMAAGVQRHVREPHLAAMLEFFSKYVGSSPYLAPAMLNSLAYAQLGHGLWYVVGGMYNLARGLAALLGELGVGLHLGAEVTRIVRRGRAVCGVEVAGHGTRRADVVVSNVEVIPAYRRLLGVSAATLAPMQRRWEPACSGLVMHLGVEGDFPALAHHNFFFSRDPRRFLRQVHEAKELPEDPTVYVVYPTRSEPGLAPAGHSIIKALPHVPYLQDEPADYAALAERVLAKLERMGLTRLRERIVTQEVLTPHDLERLYGSNRGAIYGVAADRRRNLALKAPKRSALFDRLYFVGGSVNPGGGTPMVVLCGQKVADLVRAEHG